MIKHVLYTVSACLLFACGTTKQDNELIDIPVDETGVEEFDDSYDYDDQGFEEWVETYDESSKNTYNASRTMRSDIQHTKLEVNFDWNKARLNGVATLTVKPHFYPTDSLYLDAKGMDIQSVTLGGKPLKYTYDSLTMSIQLDKSYTRNDSYNIRIAYTAKPDERQTTGGEAITSDKGLFFINPKGTEKHKMPQIWTQGETESNSVWFPTIDSPNAKSSQELYLTVDKKYTTLSNGVLVSSKVNTDGTRTDYWKQEKPHAHYLFMMAVGQFKVVKDFYTRPNGTKMEVNYLVEPEWEGQAKAIFGETPAMIAYFSKLLGVEYAWDKYSQIVVRDYVSGAMENTGAVVFGDYVYKTNRELEDGNDQSTIAHELFHHWFGDLVTCESWANLPLNESFANYSQYLWDEHRYGLDEADFQAENEASGYYQSIEFNSDGYHDLIWYNHPNREAMFDAHSYNKGGRILHMLRNYLGDEAFFKGLNVYLTTHQYKSAEIHDLRQAMESVSGEDLNWFFNQWFLASGHPVLRISQEVDANEKKILLKVIQAQNLELSPLYKLPVTVAIWDETGKHLHKIDVNKEEETFEFSYSGKLNNVVFDEQCMLLAKVKQVKPIEQYVHQYYNSKRYTLRKESVLRAGKFPTNSGAQQLVLDALSDSFWGIREMAINTINILPADKKSEAIKRLKIMLVTDSKSNVRLAALKTLEEELASSELLELCLDRVQKDKSMSVFNEALNYVTEEDVKQAIHLTTALLKEPGTKLYPIIASVYAKDASESYFTFFVESLKDKVFTSYDQVNMLNYFTIYLTKQKGVYIDKAVDTYAFLNKEGDQYTKMYMGQLLGYLLSNIAEKKEVLSTKIDALRSEGRSQEAQEKAKELASLSSAENRLSELMPPTED